MYNMDPLHGSLWRIFENRTKLSNVIDPSRELLAIDIKDALHCDINWLAMDMLTMNDERLKAAIWSWAPSYPLADQGRCAVYKVDEGIKNALCDKVISGFTCEHQSTHQYRTISIKGVWQDGKTLCKRVLGLDWNFSMPVNSSRLHLLKEALDLAALSEVGLITRKMKRNWLVDN